MRLAFRPRDTRLQKITLIRQWLLHAAGELTIHPECCVTAFWADPSGALQIWAEDGDPHGELDLLRSGAVRFPRSLRRRWLDALAGSGPSHLS